MTFLLPKYGWHASGGFSVVYTYASLLAQAGHRVHVLHPRRLPAGGWPAPVGATGRARRAAARIRDRIMTPRLRWADIDARVQLAYIPEISARHVPDGDAVIATWWSTAEAAMELPESKGRRFHLIQGHEIWNGAEDRVHAAWRAPLHKIFIAGWLQRLAIELGVPEQMTTLIPNAIPHDIFFVTKPLEARPARVAMLYSSQPYKGGTIGIDMLCRAKHRVPELSAVLFGVERAPHGLPSWITYVRDASARQLAAQVYNEAAIYLCPSLSEGWHLPPAEAMACGCALASSDIGGVQDYAVDGDTALLFPPGDVDAGATCVVKLLSDGAERMRFAARARDRISTFSWDRSTAQLEALLERIAGTPDPVSR